MRRIKAVRLLWGLGLVAAGLSLAFVLRRVVSVENGGNRAESDGRSAYLWKRVRPTITEVHSEQQRPLSSQREIVLSAADGALDCLQRQSMPRQLEGRWQQWGEIFLVFFGKPIMQALKTITSSRGWQVKLMSEESPEKLQSLVSPERFLVVFTSSKLYHHRVITELANSTNALVGTVGNAYKVTGAKRAQLSSFRRHFQSFGCEMEAAGMMPRSFILDNPTECVQFFRYSSKRPEAWWVLKPSSGQGGDGISIHSNLSHFYGEFATCMKSPDAIVQEYITDPLLLGNRKFDVRAYILIARTSPHFLVFDHDGYLRLSVKEFDIHGEREVHLTNSHVQVKVEGFSMEKHFWSFKDLQAYLDEHRPGDGMEFVSEKLVPFIQKVGLFIAHTGLFLWGMRRKIFTFSMQQSQF